MSGNYNSTEETELSVKQEQFIAALIAGNSIVVSAKAVGIAEKTAHAWLKKPHVQAAYKSAKQAAFDEVLEGLRECASAAISTLKSNLTALETSVQVRAAHIILTQAIQVHKMNELEARIAELEEMVKAGTQ
jgi:phage terminase small subunit